jgi:uncharacterized protein (TIGR03067 family)
MTLRTASPLLLALLLLATGAWTPGSPPKKAPDILKGKWSLTDMTVNGESVPAKERRKFSIIFNGPSMTVSGFNGKKEFTYSLDSSTAPKSIDALALNGNFKGKTAPGIYDLQGDTLRLCLPNDDVGERPTDFTAEQGSNRALLILVRGGKGRGR